MLSYQESTERAAELVRLVIPKLAKAQLPINPVNYALMYEYCLGRNKALNQLLDEVLSGTRTLTPSDSNNLFRIHILGATADRLEVVGNKVRSILDTTSEMLHGTGDDIDQYSRELERTKSVLDHPHDPADVRPLVSGLMAATQTMVASNTALNHELDLRTGEIERLKSDIETIRTEASLDPLTGAANRKTFDDNLAKALREQRNGNTKTCLLIIDLDKFKQINDTYGHLVGDRVLCFVADTLNESVRGSDTVARYGGEEFAVILLKSTPDGAMKVAENIRKNISEARIRRGQGGETLGQITVSIGVSYARPGTTSESLIELADQAMYKSKREGRNRVTLGGEAE